VLIRMASDAGAAQPGMALLQTVAGR
jgi:hypothetical protein